MLTQILVKNLFTYKDGFLYRGCKKVGGIHKGTQRRVTFIKGKPYLCYRLIFLYFKGFLPYNVEHIDGDTLNDRIENLRAATHSENMKNRKSSKNSSSQYLGVRFHRGKNWRVQIQHNGVERHVGCFKTEEEAALAYNKEAVKSHGEFARLNIIKEIAGSRRS